MITMSSSFPTLHARAGVGLKPEHYRDILEGRPDIGWFEIHPENYMGAGGPPHHNLTRVRALYPVSLHGVGLSLGASGRLSKAHLARLKAVIDRYAPDQFSEHLAWSTHDGVFMNDLLPLPYTRETLDLVADHIDETHEALGRRMLIENPATYVVLASSEMDEVSFLTALARRTGCGLLLDINNVFVSATNHGFDPAAYLDAVPVSLVGEIHLAGHAAIDAADGVRLLVDAHDRSVADPVWDLYRRFIARSGPLPTLIEWDNDVPDFATLADEAAAAGRILARAAKRKAA